jgi:hypothetical protein
VQLCENGFSNYGAKIKYRNTLNGALDLRIKLFTVKPNIKIICEKKRKTVFALKFGN